MLTPELVAFLVAARSKYKGKWLDFAFVNKQLLIGLVISTERFQMKGAVLDPDDLAPAYELALELHQVFKLVDDFNWK